MGDWRLTGYAARFDCEQWISEDSRDGRVEYLEKIAPGAFVESLTGARHLPLVFVDGMDRQVLASVGAGSLYLEENAAGLRIVAVVRDPSRPVARLCERAADGELGMSFSGRMRAQHAELSWRRRPTGARRTVRVLDRVDLRMVKVTATPAYKAARVWAEPLDSRAGQGVSSGA